MLGRVEGLTEKIGTSCHCLHKIRMIFGIHKYEVKKQLANTLKVGVHFRYGQEMERTFTVWNSKAATRGSGNSTFWERNSSSDGGSSFSENEAEQERTRVV